MRKLSRLSTHLAALTIALLAGSYLVLAQQPPAAGQGRGPGGPPQPMSFFITSVPKGDGANYGGLAGADAYCQQLGDRGRTRRARHLACLPEHAGRRRRQRARPHRHRPLVQRAAASASARPSPSCTATRSSRRGWATPLGKQFSLTEKQALVNGVGDMPNQHDILTGSTPDGRAYTDAADHTCNNWTSNAHVEPPAEAPRHRQRRPRPVHRRSSATTTSRAAATARGTPRTRAAAAARRTWCTPAAPVSCTASR